MASLISPGVQYTERDTGQTVTAGASSNAGFAGFFNWGPCDTITNISNTARLAEVFGPPVVKESASEQSFMTAASFLTYASTLQVVRANDTKILNAVDVGDAIGIPDNGVFTGAISSSEQLFTLNANIKDVLGGTLPNIAARYGGDAGNSIEVFLVMEANYDAIELSSNSVIKALRYKPNTTEYSDGITASNGSTATALKDEIHVIVTDAKGDITGTAGKILEIHEGLSIYKNAKDGYGISIFWKDAVNKNSNVIYALESTGSDFLEDNATETKLPNALGTVTPAVTTTTYEWQDTSTVVDSGTLTVDSATEGTAGADDTITFAAGTDLTALNAAFGVNNLTAPVDAPTTETDTSTYSRLVLKVNNVVVPVTGVDLAALTVTVANGTTTSLAIGATVTDLTGMFNTETKSVKTVTVTTDATAALNKVQLSKGTNATGVPEVTGLITALDLYVDSETSDIDMLFSYNYLNEDSQKAVDIKMIAIAEKRRDIIACISAPLSITSEFSNTRKLAKVIDKYKELQSSMFTVRDTSPVYVYNRFNDTYVWIPQCGNIAGLMARVDALENSWVSPAGYSRGILSGVIKLAYSPTQSERDALYLLSANPTVNVPGQGIILMGDKTGTLRPGSFDRIGVRRLFNKMEGDIVRSAQFVLFEQNTDQTRSAFKVSVESYLREIESGGGISAYNVVCDTNNNTPSIIDTNQFVATIQVRPTKSINFITLNFVATRTGAAFTEV